MKNKIILGLVLLLFFATRIYKISSIPASVYWDEASIGYNAYSIATDLKDEWGSLLPLHFRAFGEFKLPVYIYSVVPFVKIFGLNAFSVRMPAVLYSLGSLILVYFITKKITKKDWAGILASFILGVSSWLFIFSRTGYEATAGLFFFLLGTYTMLQFGQRGIGILASAIYFILSFYSYNSFRLIIPFWIAGLAIYKFKKKNIASLIVAGSIFLVSLVPVYRLYKFDTGGIRLSQVEITNPKDFITNYFANLSPFFLFLSGDTNSRSQIPGHGELYLLDAPLLLFGIYYTLKSKEKLNYLPLLMLLIAPIPAAITKESPHALRAILAAPALAMLSTLGVLFLKEKYKKIRGYILAAVVLIYIGFFGFYFRDFLTKYQDLSAKDWQYPYKEIFAEKTSGVITDIYAQPYIFALFYQKVDPQEFRTTVVYNPPDKWGFSLVSSFNGFEFK